MELNDIQKQTVAEWVAEGVNLSDIQKKIKAEFDITMTYMDVRFLVIDIGAEVKDKPEPVSVKKDEDRSGHLFNPYVLSCMRQTKCRCIYYDYSITQLRRMEWNEIHP